MGRIISLDILLDWRTLFSRKETNVHQSNSDANVLVYRKERRTTMIFEKTLPCGLLLRIVQYKPGEMIQVKLTNSNPDTFGGVGGVGAFFPKLPNGERDKNNMYLFISPRSLPVIREALDEFDSPKPKWYEFWKSRKS